MDRGNEPECWEVDVGPPGQAQRIQVPDDGLQAFLRALASQGIDEFRIASGACVFLITRAATATGSSRRRAAKPATAPGDLKRSDGL